MGNKKYIVVMMVLLSILMTGFAFGSVKLRDDKFLIDLDRSITAPSAGGYKDGSDEGTENLDNTGDSDVTDVENADANITDQGESSPAAVTGRSFEIRVRHVRITCMGRSFTDAEELRLFLIGSYNVSDTVTLVDAYAEADTYSAVRDMLEELRDTAGLKYTERQEQ